MSEQALSPDRRIRTAARRIKATSRILQDGAYIKSDRLAEFRRAAADLVEAITDWDRASETDASVSAGFVFVPDDAPTGKRHPLNMRTTAEVRRKIEEAASASGLSLAQEVERRIERSFAAHDNGIPLRDWFAGQALMGLLADGGDGVWIADARDAYDIADAMLAERAQR